MHFQDIISTLNRFGRTRDALLQPYDTKKGAGTMSLTPCCGRLVRSLARPIPAPSSAHRWALWRQPQPAQHYFQYLRDQTLPGWDPGDLSHLKAVTVADHDIRFVEDNWESPPRRLGRWLGGKPDGMEVTQFTYFQQVIDCWPA